MKKDQQVDVIKSNNAEAKMDDVTKNSQKNCQNSNDENKIDS